MMIPVAGLGLWAAGPPGQLFHQVAIPATGTGNRNFSTSIMLILVFLPGWNAKDLGTWFLSFVTFSTLAAGAIDESETPNLVSGLTGSSKHESHSSSS